MGTIVNQVIQTLTAAGIRSDEAYPGGRIPALSGVAAAVRLGKVDRSVRTTTVEVVVMSPAREGGSACEAAALRAVEVLQGMGGTCVKQVCRFDEMADVFYIEMEATFFGTATENGWSPGPGYTVLIGIQPLPYAVRFEAGRSTGSSAASIANAAWEFTVEELLPPDVGEPPEPAEPFSITVSRAMGQDTYTECRWISVRREETIRGVSQIRKGTSAARGGSGIL
jgi:hypothetical protein